MPQAGYSSDDFTAELDAIEDTESKSGNDEQDNEFDAWSDLDTLRMVLTMPQPDAPMHKVRRALEVAQQAYTAVWSELRALKKDHAMLQAAVPACSRNRVLKKTSTIDNDIARAGKMYAMLNYFWVMSGLFPTKPQPDIDPRSDTCWSSPEAKLNGAMAELYQCIPKALHKPMETYPQFGSAFRAAVNSKRSNILHSLKDCAGLIFSSLKLNPTVFTDEAAKKKENAQLLALLKKDVGGKKYTHLAPILFMDPSALVPDAFLKTPVMAKIIRVEIFGKASLSGKTKGHPKARGQRWSMQCVTEGLIAGAAIVARFFHEIDYAQDFDFYLEQLFKRSPWATSVINYYNQEVFSMSSVLATSGTPTPPSASQPHTWEDDFLQQLEDPASAPQTIPIPAPQLLSSSHITYAPTSASRADMNAVATVNYQTAMSISNPGGPATTTQLQLEVDIGELSLDGARTDLAPSASRGGRVSVAQHRVTAQAVQTLVDSDMVPVVPLAPPPALKRVTRNGGAKPRKVSGRK
ncbi:uncharacterized protein EDB93DRAFT_1254814 [Suillus bovinus]|uniref:uncharacterized protein n=1 Tax=Suillus bovinus TaxID=48563 RepID=UPI001B85ED4F|nr:uncharacterized protein EDB93DRAFT_1254814 [Suillus bovinus]KAG2133603.1 hypothetical protein EDB93DRAFT_1254814 [Suillus bovinus]